MTRIRSHWPYIIVLVALTAIIFSQTMGAEFIWDDQFFIQENLFLRSWTDLPRLFTNSMTAGSGQAQGNFYRPLQAVTHLLDVQLFGLNPWRHHLTNIALQIALAVAMFLALYRLIGTDDRWPAFFAVTLWIFHPLQSEIVGYLSGRGDQMVFLFTALAVLSWPKRTWLSLVFCLAAMLSKESGVLTPLFLVMADWLDCRKRGARARPLLWLFPIALSAFYSLARMTVLNFQNTLNFYNESNVLTGNYSYRVYTYFSTLAKGAQLIAWPVDLHHERSWSVYPSLEAPIVATGLALAIGLLVNAALSFRRRPLIAFGSAWFLLATLPTSNLIALINALIYDHWFVFPMLGLALIAGSGFAAWLKRARLSYVTIAWLAMILPLTATTWRQNQTWQTAEAQFSQILSFEPASWKTMNNLAMRYSETGRLTEGEALYRRSLELFETPQARNNLGRLLLEKNQLVSARAELERAAQLDPRLFQARTGLGLVALASGDCAEARRHFEAALEIYPDTTAQAGLRKVPGSKSLSRNGTCVPLRDKDLEPGTL